MGFEEDHTPSWGLGRLYMVQLTGRLLYSDDEAAKSNIMDSSTCELWEDVCSSRIFKFVQECMMSWGVEDLRLVFFVNEFVNRERYMT